MKTIVSFACDAHPVPEFEQADPPGEGVARLLMGLLSGEGARLAPRSPTAGEGGWSVWFSLYGESFSAFINSAGIGRPIRDYWVAGFGPIRRGILRRQTRLDRVLEIVGRLVEATDEISEVRWWDPRTFVEEVRRPGTHLIFEGQ